MTKNFQLMLIAICSALSGLLFGYDVGVISGALLIINKSFVISSATQGWLVAMVPIGALFSSLVSGKISDFIGRKKALFLTALLFTIGSIICILPNEDISFLVVGRLLLGIAIGIGSCISPVYTSELASEQQRGQMVNLFVVFIQLGVFLSFVTSYLLTPSGDWQAMIGIGIFPAIVLMIAVLFLPESPRWLMLTKRPDEALRVLSHLYGQEKALREVSDIQDNLSIAQMNFLTLFSQPRFLKVIFIGVAVSVFTQTVGINAFNYYAPTIFQKTGFALAEHATFYTMFIGLMLVASTICSLFFIDIIGRRKPLLYGTAGIFTVLLAITVGFTFVDNELALGKIFFISALLFMALHGLSIGPACFLIPSEVFPIQLRGLGMGISVAANWAANVVIAAMVPSIIQNFGVSTLFGIFFVITVLAWIIFYFYVPETKGITLEQIERNVIAGNRAIDLGKRI